jgi:hypothetical protein
VSFVFEGWSHWTWVGIAWAQVVVAYVGYLVYLGWRRQQLLRDQDARRVIERPAAGGGGRP